MKFTLHRYRLHRQLLPQADFLHTAPENMPEKNFILQALHSVMRGIFVGSFCSSDSQKMLIQLCAICGLTTSRTKWHSLNSHILFSRSTGFSLLFKAQSPIKTTWRQFLSKCLNRVSIKPDGNRSITSLLPDRVLVHFTHVPTPYDFLSVPGYLATVVIDGRWRG